MVYDANSVQFITISFK